MPTSAPATKMCPVCNRPVEVNALGRFKDHGHVVTGTCSGSGTDPLLTERRRPADHDPLPHAPRPWRVRHDAPHVILDANGNMIALGYGADQGAKTAALVVQCVNTGTAPVPALSWRTRGTEEAHVIDDANFQMVAVGYGEHGKKTAAYIVEHVTRRMTATKNPRPLDTTLSTKLARDLVPGDLINIDGVAERVTETITGGAFILIKSVVCEAPDVTRDRVRNENAAICVTKTGAS